MRSSLPSRTSLVSLAACLCLLLAGCQSGASEASKGAVRSDGFPAPGRDAVWEAAWQAFREQQLVVDEDESSAQAGVLVSRWRASLSPFSRDGFRDKATLRIHPVEGRPGYWRTETNVVRQVNEEMTDPGNPMVADWGGDTRNTSMETLINRRVEMNFLPDGVSDVFRRHHGMAPGSTARIPDTTPVERPPANNLFDFLEGR